jgi:opacity protein-like surface antigen
MANSRHADGGIEMRKTTFSVSLIMAAIYFGPIISHASAKNIKVGVQIGHFSPQDWIVQERFDDGDGIYHGDFPYYGYSGFGNGIDFQVNIQYDLGLWGLRLDFGRKSMSDRAVLEGGVSSFDWAGEMEIFSAKSFIINRLYGRHGDISPYLGVGAGICFGDFEVTLTDRNHPDLPGWDSRSSSDPMVLGFLAGFDYALIANVILQCEFEYDCAESDWKLELSSIGGGSEVRNLNIGGTTIRAGIGYGF